MVATNRNWAGRIRASGSAGVDYGDELSPGKYDA